MAGIKNDLTGEIYDRLTVLSYHGKNKHGISTWNCRCSCGVEKIINSNSLRTGCTKSCGCLKAAVLKKGRDELHVKQTTHGRSRTREHCIWLNIIYRCENKNCHNYIEYGGRGIKICERWRHSFENFISDMGPRPSPSHTVDRKNNDGDYCSENCRWATKKEQANNRRCNEIREYKGESMTVSQFAEKYGIKKHVIFGRLHAGWTIDEAIETPIRIIKVSDSRGQKLTEQDVRDIRNNYHGQPHREIAAKFGVSRPVISKILRRESWKHVA